MTSETKAIEKYRKDWRVDPVLWLFWVCLGALSPVSVDLSEYITVSLSALFIVSTVFIAFRMGSWWALAGVLAMKLPWIFVSVDGLADGFDDIVYEYDLDFMLNVRESFFSVDTVILHCLVAWSLGWIFSKIETYLAGYSVFLAELFPRTNKAYVRGIFSFIREKLFLWRKGQTDDGLSNLEKFSNTAKAYWLKLKQLVIIPVVFAILNISVMLFDSANSDFQSDTEGGLFVSFALMPEGTLFLAVALVSFFSRSRMTILAIWVAQFFSLFGLGSFVGPMYDDFPIEAGAFGPADALGLSVVSWIFVRLGEIYEDTDIKEKLSKASTVFTRPAGAVQKMSTATMVVPLILFLSLVQIDIPAVDSGTEPDRPATSSGFGAGLQQNEENAEHGLEEILVSARSFDRPVYISFILFLFGFLVLAGYLENGEVASNRIFMVLLPFCFFSFSFEISNTVSVFTPYVSAPLLVLFVVAPLLGMRLDLTKLVICRSVLVGGFVFASLSHWYSGAWMGLHSSLPFMYLVDYQGVDLNSVWFVISLLTLEGLARVIRYFAVKATGTEVQDADEAAQENVTA